MLNLKKGLALVLAAATAFTYAPLTSFAAARTWDDDGLTTTAGIDSIDLKEFTLDASVSTSSKKLTLKEHKDLSSTGKTVGGYKITITRGKGSKDIAGSDKDSYYDLVDVKAGDTSLDNSTITGSVVDKDNSWGSSNTKATTSTWIINNVPGKEGTPGGGSNDETPYTVNGASAEFVLGSDVSKSAADSVTVTVEALTGTTADASSADDKSTFTIKLNRHTESIEWGDVYLDNDKIAATDDEYTVPEYDTNDNSNIVRVQFKTTNSTSAPSIKEITTSGNARGSASYDAVQSSGNNSYYDTVYFRPKTTGKITYTVKVNKTTEADKTFDKTFTFNVTSANGKLRVTYQLKDGTTWTYKNNNEDRSTGTNATSEEATTKNSVENGQIVVSTNVYQNEGSNYVVNNDTSSVTTEALQKQLKYGFNTQGVLPEARPIVDGSNSTLQITASSDAGADISYSLVAPSELTDKTYSASGKQESGSYKYDSKVYNFNPVSGKFDGTLDGYSQALSTASDITDNHAVQTTSIADTYYGIKGLDGVGDGDTIKFTEAAAKQYGAVDSTGLVTLKSSVVNVPLYVVVTAKAQKANADAGTTARKTSTYIIPVEINANQSLWFYAGAENSNAEIDEQNITEARTQSADAYDTLYLSDAQKTDTITTASNAGDSYVTVSLKDDDGKFTYNPTTKTVSVTSAAKDGDSNELIFKVTSAPNIEGTYTGSIKVQYKKDWAKSATLALSDVSVRKGSTTARKQITASAVTPANATVIYDSYDYFVKDSTRPTGYRRLIASDAGFGDVNLTQNGYVTYVKNSGEVYVRAHAEASKTIPSKYAYSKVSYGAASLVTNNTLAIDKKSVVIKEGETATINATGNTVISATSSDTSVATVATAATANTGAAITVTGVKPGETTVKVTAAADAANGIDAAEIEVPVVVTDKNGNTVDDVTTPGKVTGLKVKNKKGAHVSVSWTNQGKNINYRVWKKVGKGKWVGKNVAGSKTTLSVKKGAKVQVKVKAYVKNSAGKTTWGPKATKAKTFKTDKK